MKSILIKAVCGMACVLFSLGGDAEGMRQFNNNLALNGNQEANNMADRWNGILQDIDQAVQNANGREEARLIQSGINMMYEHLEEINEIVNPYTSPALIARLFQIAFSQKDLIGQCTTWLAGRCAEAETYQAQHAYTENQMLWNNNLSATNLLCILTFQAIVSRKCVILHCPYLQN